MADLLPDDPEKLGLPDFDGAVAAFRAAEQAFEIREVKTEERIYGDYIKSLKARRLFCEKGVQRHFLQAESTLRVTSYWNPRDSARSLARNQQRSRNHLP